MAATPTDRVVLTGFMATGKTTVGRQLADQLGYEFIDTDELLQRRHGPIGELFDQLGEAQFREFERVLAHELSERERTVVATGGGFMIDEQTAQVLASGSRVFALTATVDTIMSRLESDATPRPLLDYRTEGCQTQAAEARSSDEQTERRSRVSELLAERAASYSRYRTVATDNRSPGEIVAVILEHLG